MCWSSLRSGEALSDTATVQRLCACADSGWDSADSLSVRLAAIVGFTTFDIHILERVKQLVAELIRRPVTVEWIHLHHVMRDRCAG